MRRVADTSLRREPLSVQVLHADDLVGAFAKFSQASTQLEVHYNTLRQETEALRARLKQKDEEIAQHARLATLGQTAAALAHEIRNPLCALKLFLSLLREEVSGSPSAGEIVSHMDRTMRSLDHVVENILHFSKSNHTAFEIINVGSMLREVTQEFLQTSGPEISVQCDLKGNPYIRGNEHALRQAFTNLMNNAAEAMRMQGVVRISSTQVNPHTLEISVEDRGPGFDAAIFEHLFEPFVTGKREGTGLGLAVVKKILDQHGAQITVRNRPAPEHGACISIRFSQGGCANNRNPSEIITSSIAGEEEAE